MASFHNNTAPLPSSSPSNIRFLRLLKLPQSDLDPIEFQESDVVWSPDDDFSDSTADTPSRSPSTVSGSPTNPRNIHNQIHPERLSGLTSVLSDDHPLLIRRKETLSPSLSAATASRRIPPVAIQRSDVSGAAKFHQSAPVNVPIWPTKIRGRGNLGNFDEVDDELEGEEEEEEEEEEMVPPHEIVARTYVTFSVFEGAGRTLKGRDLRRVRNAVFQKTGIPCSKMNRNALHDMLQAQHESLENAGEKSLRRRIRARISSLSLLVVHAGGGLISKFHIRLFTETASAWIVLVS